VRIVITWADGRVSYAPCREEPAIRFYGEPLTGRPGFVVDATREVPASIADVIAYSMNEGPDDLEGGSFGADEDMPSIKWRLEREPTTQDQARAICDYWVRIFHLAFHPDQRGSDYVDDDGDQALSDDEVQDYDEDMANLHRLVSDPYAEGIAAFHRAGLISDDEAKTA
jgi:hypothetical protein